MSDTTKIDTIKDKMKRVREAKGKKIVIQDEASNLSTDTSRESADMPDLPKNKFLLLLNLIMEIQEDIDHIMKTL